MSVLTKKALLIAFGELLEEKPFNKITITDITARCGLNRMTFYYHFDNIYELMIWGLEAQMREVSRDCINYEGKEYLVLLPADDDANEILILEVEPVDEENENYLAVSDEAVLEAVYGIFKEKFKDVLTFEE